jgi:hypothetical protein
LAGYVTPIVLLSAVSYGNNWYNTGSATDVKPLLEGGVALAFLALFAQIPGMEPVATGLGWLAFTGMLIGPVQSPSPLQNILKITGGN